MAAVRTTTATTGESPHFDFEGFSTVLRRSADSDLRKNRPRQIQISIAFLVGAQRYRSQSRSNRSDEALRQSEERHEGYQISQVVCLNQLDCDLREARQTEPRAQAGQGPLREIRGEAH